MSTAYLELNLDELGFLGRGKSKHRPRNDPDLFGGEYPFIQTGDVKAANLYIREYSKTYNEKGLSQSKLWDKGTLLITIAANIAETAVLDIKACFPDSVVGFIPDEEKVNSYFIKYYIDYIKREMQSISHGTTQDNLSLDKIRTFKLKIPEKEIVDQVTDILLSYDYLIENNNRRIAILEEIAQSLYREWFVKFRFPGYENTKFIDSPLGKIPEAWNVEKLSEIINIDRGRSYKSAELVEEGGYAFLNLKNVAREGGFRRDGLKRYDGPFKPHQTAKSNDIIMAVTDMTQERAIIARPARVPNMGIEEFVFSMDLIKITVKEGNKESFIYSFLRYSEFPHVVKQFANGANVLHLSPKVIEDYETLTPSENIRSQFVDVISPIHEIQDKLEKKNDNLKRQRDLLLPKLISGNIRLQG